VILTTGDEGEELVKLMDFGLAKRMLTIDNSNKNLVPGSPKYMSPEVIRQQTVDGRADIYALGVMLYQMLTGAVPFNRNNPIDILAAHLNEPPPPMKSVNPSVKVPGALEELVMKCLEKRPSARFRDMQTVMDALRVAEAEMRYGISSGAVATPTPVSSKGEPDITPLSVAVSPHVAAFDIAPEKRRRISGSKNATHILTASALTLCIAVGAYYFTKDDGASSKVAAASENLGRLKRPSTQIQKNALTSSGSDIDMVFTEDELNKQNRPVKLELSSKPAGASVSFEGKLIGQTPITYELRGARAMRGQILELRFSKSGYYTYALKKTIDKDKLNLYIILTARETAPKVEPSIIAPVDQSEPVKTEEPASAHLDQNVPANTEEPANAHEKKEPEADAPQQEASAETHITSTQTALQQ
jgi:serine/threonine-protein kinase